MRALREVGGGVIIAVLSLLLVIGGISLSLAENDTPEQPTPTPLPPLFATSIQLPTFPPLATNTLEIPTTAPVVVPTDTSLPPSPTQPAPIVCNPPAGWLRINVSVNDTLYAIAERYKTSTDLLNVGNCLNNTLPLPGSTLYVPPVPTVTVIPCGPYAGWVKAYLVKPGDNLYRISLLYRTSVAQLQVANCMGGSITIYAGQSLWVPNVPTSTPGITVIPTFTTPTATVTATSTFIVTETPSPTTQPTNTSVAPTPTITVFPTTTTPNP